MKSPIIETNKYIIRPFKDSDAELWQVWDIDAEVPTAIYQLYLQLTP